MYVQLRQCVTMSSHNNVCCFSTFVHYLQLFEAFSIICIACSQWKLHCQALNCLLSTDLYWVFGFDAHIHTQKKTQINADIHTEKAKPHITTWRATFTVKWHFLNPSNNFAHENSIKIYHQQKKNQMCLWFHTINIFYYSFKSHKMLVFLW